MTSPALLQRLREKLAPLVRVRGGLEGDMVVSCADLAALLDVAEAAPTVVALALSCPDIRSDPDLQTLLKALARLEER